MERLDELTEMLLWMACRYACNRRSIASVTLPQRIVAAYWYKMDDYQRVKLGEDIEREKQEGMDLSWVKFYKALNPIHHKNVELTDGTKDTIFEVNNRIYSLNKYLLFPYQEWFIPNENIKW